MSGFISYDSNNSGGRWWLKDEDWKALEDAGWHVDWIIVTHKTKYGDYTSAESGRMYPSTRKEMRKRAVIGKPRWDPDSTDNMVVAVAHSYEDAVMIRGEHGDYMGALAVSAHKAGDNPNALVYEFESITGQSASAKGCPCCGPPHSFEWYDDDGTHSYGHTVVTHSGTFTWE